MPTSPKTHLQRLRPAVPKPVDDRPSAAKRGYGRGWRELRESVASTLPAICVECGDALPSKLMHLDHKVPRSRGGSDDLSNLQWLCFRCHSRKTAKEDGGFGKSVQVPDLHKNTTG